MNMTLALRVGHQLTCSLNIGIDFLKKKKHRLVKVNRSLDWLL